MVEEAPDHSGRETIPVLHTIIAPKLAGPPLEGPRGTDRQEPDLRRALLVQGELADQDVPRQEVHLQEGEEHPREAQVEAAPKVEMRYQMQTSPPERNSLGKNSSNPKRNPLFRSQKRKGYRKNLSR